MSTNTWLISGIPRSGSSLCCRLAGELPNTVGLSEPIRLDTFKGADTREAVCRCINEFAVQARARIQAEGLAPSVQVDGRLDDDMVSRHPSDSLRQRRAREGEIAVRKPLSSDFTLIIKHNALFAALLPNTCSVVSLPSLGTQSRGGFGVLANCRSAREPRPHSHWGAV